MSLFVSKNNTTTIQLAANASFIGYHDTLSTWQEIDINIAGAPDVAPATLYFEFSPDGTNWDVSVPLALAGPDSVPIVLRSILPHFRVRYINGGIALTEFRLTTIFHRTSAIRLTRFLSQDIDINEPVEIVRIAKSTLPDGAATEATLAAMASQLGAATLKTLYDIQSTVIYVGTAPPGTATSASAWKIRKTSLDVDGNPISTLWSADDVKWDDRVIISYT
jgi:hypothetical protein